MNRIYDSLKFWTDKENEKRMVEITYRELGKTKHPKTVTMVIDDLGIDVAKEVIPLFDKVIDAIEK